MTIETSTAVRRACSQQANASDAIAELAEQLRAPAGSLVVFFVAPQHDRSELTAAIAVHFADCEVIGCTTAGEFGPAGYAEGTVTALVLSAQDFQFEVRSLHGLQDAELDDATHIAQNALSRMQARGLDASAERCFAFMMLDGLCMREEAVVSSFHRALGGIQLFGGSAGDNLDFGETYVYCDGEFHTDAAVFVLVHTELPFEVFRTQHFVETDVKMVVTEADPLTRTVTEINAEPAAQEYARLVGLEVDQLTPMIFSAHPVLVRVGGKLYLRSIAKVNDDESLSFFCAIERGNVLTVARGIDMVGSLQTSFDEIRRRIGEPSLTIGCDCILRSIEGQQKELRGRIAEVLNRNQAVGFATYGEQYDAMHVNQTLTGVMIGRRSEI